MTISNMKTVILLFATTAFYYCPDPAGIGAGDEFPGLGELDWAQ